MTDLFTAHQRYCRAAGLSANTISDRLKLLGRVDADLPLGLEQATVEELAEWLACDRWDVQTRATYYGHLAGFFRWACDPRNPVLDYDPTVSLSRPHVPRRAPRPVTDEELRFVLTEARRFWRIAAVLAAYAGLRCFEIAKIRREDITEDTLTIAGKGGKDAVLPTHPEIWNAVRNLPGDRLTLTFWDRKVDAGHISRRFGEHMRYTHKRPGITLHRLRHWYGTNLLNHGADLRTVQELMRHSSPATTAIYTQITDRQRQIAIAALPTLAPASA